MRRPSSLVALAVALVIGGCGHHRAVPARGRTVTLRLGEYTIRPQVVRIPAGVVRIAARDVGILTHNVHVIGPQGAPGGEDRDRGGTPIAQPGDTVHSPALRLGPGRYTLSDTLSNHAVLGATGTLVVTRR